MRSCPMSKAPQVTSRRGLGPIQVRKRANALGNVSAASTWSWVMDVSFVQNELRRGTTTGRTNESNSSTTATSDLRRHRRREPRMSSHDRVPAVEPEDLERRFVERVNAGDVEGLVALYEPDAVMA